VDQEHVRVAGRAEQRACAPLFAKARVAGLVLLPDVGLGLDDAPAEPPAPDAVAEVLADEAARDLQARLRVERPPELLHGGRTGRRGGSARPTTAATRPSATSAS